MFQLVLHFQSLGDTIYKRMLQTYLKIMIYQTCSKYIVTYFIIDFKPFVSEYKNVVEK